MYLLRYTSRIRILDVFGPEKPHVRWSIMSYRRHHSAVEEAEVKPVQIRSAIRLKFSPVDVNLKRHFEVYKWCHLGGEFTLANPSLKHKLAPIRCSTMALVYMPPSTLPCNWG